MFLNNIIAKKLKIIKLLKSLKTLQETHSDVTYLNVISLFCIKLFENRRKLFSAYFSITPAALFFLKPPSQNNRKFPLESLYRK